MNQAERERAAGLMEARMDELGLTPPALARKAHLDPTTVRAALRGERIPTITTRRKIMAALELPLGSIERRARAKPLAEVDTETLLDELCDRIRKGEIRP